MCFHFWHRKLFMNFQHTTKSRQTSNGRHSCIVEHIRTIGWTLEVITEGHPDGLVVGQNHSLEDGSRRYRLEIDSVEANFSVFGTKEIQQNIFFIVLNTNNHNN